MGGINPSSGRKRIRAEEKTGLWSFIRAVSANYNEYDGYAVRVLDALAVLAKNRPAAAEWWRNNTPYLLTPRALFLFDAEACEELVPETIPIPSTNFGTVSLNCPNCGGQLPDYHQGVDHFKCEYCGTTVLLR